MPALTAGEPWRGRKMCRQQARSGHGFSRVQTVRKARGCKNDIIGALAFAPGEWIRDRLECDPRLDAGAADRPSGTIFGVVGRETKILRQQTDVGPGNEIQLVRA